MWILDHGLELRVRASRAGPAREILRLARATAAGLLGRRSGGERCSSDNQDRCRGASQGRGLCPWHWPGSGRASALVEARALGPV